jgi:hypothetical protein
LPRRIAASLCSEAGARAPAQLIASAILVADFDNTTGDAVFDGALEQPLTIAMEGASFVTTYWRRDARSWRRRRQRDAAGCRRRLVAFREGIKYVPARSVVAGSSG